MGCGPNAVAGDPQTCGGDEPIRLLEGISSGDVDRAGGRILAYGFSTPFDVGQLELFTVGSCGENPVRFRDLDPKAPLSFSVAGPHVLKAQLDGGVSWVDALEGSLRHPLFSEVASCVQPVAGGLVAQSTDAAVWFHPDPERSDVTPRVIVERAIAPDFPSIPTFLRPYCSEFDTERPVVDGDGVLVAEADGPLVRIALPSGEREVLVEGPVGEFAVLEDPRYLLWRGGSTLDPDRDCCRINLLDRRTGTSEAVGGGLIVGNVGWEGEWLDTYSLWSSGEQYETFRNVVTGESLRIDDWWDLQAPLSDTDLLISRTGHDDVRILDVTTGVLHPVDFPALRWPERIYDDGAVALRTDHPDEARGDLLLLPFGSRRPQLLATDVPVDWARTHGGNVLFIDRDSDEGLGSLVLIERNGDRRELAAGVSAFSVPHHGTEREHNEVLWFVAEGRERGLWRFVLP